MTLAPELSGMGEVIKAATKNGVVLSIGHSAATINEALAAIDNGAAHITHLFNVMTPFHHRQPIVTVAALLQNELKVELISEGIHAHRLS